MATEPRACSCECRLLATRFHMEDLKRRLENVRECLGDLGLVQCNMCSTLMRVDGGAADYCRTCPLTFCQDCAIGQMCGDQCLECE